MSSQVCSLWVHFKFGEILYVIEGVGCVLCVVNDATKSRGCCHSGHPERQWQNDHMTDARMETSHVDDWSEHAHDTSSHYDIHQRPAR